MDNLIEQIEILERILTSLKKTSMYKEIEFVKSEIQKREAKLADYYNYNSMLVDGGI